MRNNSSAWWDTTWNPIIGCSHASPGCANCYAEQQAAIRAKNPLTPQYAQVVGEDGRWNGKTALVPSAMGKPLHWRKPRRIFAFSMTDPFHPSTPYEWLDCAFALMAMCPQHTFMLLTKRADRLPKYFEHLMSISTGKSAWMFAELMLPFLRKNPRALPEGRKDDGWPLPNVWLGVTAENQEQADARIPHLLATPAAKRFVSIEPMLGPVAPFANSNVPLTASCPIAPPIDWIICGGETGPGARPMHPDWVESLRDQCQGAEVPFFFKGWGEWLPGSYRGKKSLCMYRDGVTVEFEHEAILAEERRSGMKHNSRSSTLISRVGKRKSGRLLDGREWNQTPGGER